MFDRAVRRRVDPFLNRLAIRAKQRGIGADQVTWAGFTIGLGCMAAVATGSYGIGLILLLINRLFDGLDGAVARATVPTARGAYLDIVLDFLFYAGFVFAFAVAQPADAVAAAFLIFSFVGTGSSFLAYAVIAAQRGWQVDGESKKGFAHLGGLAEGTETILVFAVMLIWPDSFVVLAWIFGALCWVTTVTRVATTLRALRP